MRCLTSACMLTFALHAQLGAQNPAVSPVRRPVAPFAMVSSTGFSTRTSDARHVSIVPRKRIDFGISIDSAPGGTLFSRMMLDLQAKPAVVVTARVPVRDGAFQVPQFSLQPPRSSPTDAFRRVGGSLPAEQSRQIAFHASTRQLIELAALFEPDPGTGAVNRRETHFADGTGDISLTIDAVRESRKLRDTIVQARMAHIIRDSTVLTVNHAYLAPASYIDRVGRAREVVRGTIVGHRLIDAESQHAFAMWDTLVLQGTLESDDGLGGVYRGPLFIRTIRTSSFRDVVWQALAPREPFDMVRYDGPSRPLPTSAERDSLFRLLAIAPSLPTRDSIRALLTTPNSFDAWPRVRERSLARGDTASVIEFLVRQVASGRFAISPDDYRMMRPALSDAGVAFRTGTDKDLAVSDIIYALLQAPPVLATRSSALARSPCTPDGCRAMMADAQNRVSPHLQAIGLVAAMVTSPQQWTDSVIKYATTNPYLKDRPVLFALGAATNAVASAKAPIPAPDASYDAWMYWLAGQDSAYIRARDADPGMRRAAASMNRVGLPDVHDGAALAIRFAEARTGRDYAAAFRRGRDTAATDSVKAFFSALLLAVNDSVYSDAEMVRIMLAPQSPERDAVKAQLAKRTRSGVPYPRARDEIASVVGRHVVNMVFGDSAVSMPAGEPRFANWFNVPKSADTLPRFVTMDSLPASVRARAAELGFNPTAPGWHLTPGASGYLISIQPIRQQGSFVLVSVSHTTLYSRSAGRSGGYAGGFMLLFAQGPSGWVIVDASAWVT